MIRTVVASLVIGISLVACDGLLSVSPTAHVDEHTLVCTDETDYSPNDRFPTGNSSPVSQHSEDLEFTQIQQPQDSILPSPLAIYFHCESNEIPSRFNEILRAHGTYLIENRDLGVTLVGYADDTRIPEYNIGLAELRAQSVRLALLRYGAAADQVATFTVGKEASEALPSDDTSDSLNRRVLLVYR